MRSLLAWVVLTGTLLAQSPKGPSPEIKGKVVDPDGMPVSAATVYVVQEGLALDDATPRSVKTDGNGSFDFRGGLQPGTYKLYSRKDVDGYLDPFDSFYSDAGNSASRVVLSQKHPTSTVTLKLGKQAAVISGKVFDIQSGAPLKAYVGLMDEEGNGHSVVVDGDYRLVVPSEKSLHLMVTVIGTRRPVIPVSSLWMEPGQRVFMDIPISSAEK
jgi:Carboxypeptidase regulatory-like domain